MLKTLFAGCLFVAALSVPGLFGQELTIGSAAPKLELKKFIKGEAVKEFEKGKTYVVELWATWCGPCLKTIPHLTKLQKKYEGEVVFIGVAVLEEDQSVVSDFVEEMGKKMDYRVALDLVPEDGDHSDGKVVKNWMEAAEQRGIPTAFVVNGDGKIAWIGHPAAMEEPLDQIVEGKWDLVVEAKKIIDAKALEKKMATVFDRLQKLFVKFQEDGESKELLAELDSAEEQVPQRAQVLKTVRFQVMTLAKDQVDEAVLLGNKYLESEEGEEPDFLNNMAWTIVDPTRESKAHPKLLRLALKVALKADNLTNNENPSIADTLAKAYFDNNELANAVKTQERVLELAEGTRMAADTSLKKRLRQYKKALEASTKKEDDGAKTNPK